MTRLFAFALLLAVSLASASAAEPGPAKKVAIGEPAPAFRIKGASGEMLDLAELSARGPVLVRLTCGCAGCDQELAYFRAIHDAYRTQGLTTLLVFKEPDAKVARYAADKKLNMLYAVDPKGESWRVFQTNTMPTNFLIEKGGRIAAIAGGCDASGLLADKVSRKVAQAVGVAPVDVKAKGGAKK